MKKPHLPRGITSPDLALHYYAYVAQIGANVLKGDIDASAMILEDIKYMDPEKGELTDLLPVDYGLIAAGDVDKMSPILKNALQARGIDLEQLRANADGGRPMRRAAMKLFASKGDVIEQRQWLDAGYAANIINPFERRAVANAMHEGVLGKALGGTYFQAQLMRGDIKGPARTERRIAERVMGIWSASGQEIRDEKLLSDTMAALNTMKTRPETRNEALAALNRVQEIAQEVTSNPSMGKLPQVVLDVLFRAGYPAKKPDGSPITPTTVFKTPKPGDPLRGVDELQRDPRALRDGSVNKKPMFEPGRWEKMNGQWVLQPVGKTALRMAA